MPKSQRPEAVHRRAALLGALVACIAFHGVSAAAPPQVIAGNEELLSAKGEEPVVVADERGGFVLVWVEVEPEDSGVYLPFPLGIRASLIPPHGGGPSPEFAVSSTVPGRQFRPKVDAYKDGSFVVVWLSGTPDHEDDGGDGSGSGVFGQIFSPDGLRRGGEFRLSASKVGNQYVPSVAFGEDGSFVATWSKLADTEVSIEAARFTPRGARRSTDVKLREEERRVTPGTMVTADSAGFTVAWNEETGNSALPRDDGVIARFNASLQPVGLLRLPDLPLVTLESSRTGSLAVFYDYHADGFSAQRFSPGGQPVGGRFSLGPSPNRCTNLRCEFLAAAAMDDHGRFVVIWETQVFEPPFRFHSLTAQLFSPRGKPLTRRFPVTPERSRDSAMAPAAALANDGTLVVVWQRNGDLFWRPFQLP
jgi:hypothetical protein